MYKNALVSPRAERHPDVDGIAVQRILMLEGKFSLPLAVIVRALENFKPGLLIDDRQRQRPS
jgi:hypothetical protein